MKRKMGKRPSGKKEGGTGIMPSQFSGKRPMVKSGDGKPMVSKGRMMKARERRLEGKPM